MTAGQRPLTAPGLRSALGAHWPEYLCEGLGLGLFMVSAGLFGTLLGCPESPVARAVPGALGRQALMGLAMGLTSIALVYSPWGRRSGAHFNPAFTLAFLRLGRVRPVDAACYLLAQFAGGLAGVLAVGAVLGPCFAQPPVSFVVTQPGPAGVVPALLAEFLITCLLMLTVLLTLNSRRLAGWTGVFSGLLVAAYITFESPVSGMSMNPARSLASALPAGIWTGWWLYWIAPPLGMLAGVELHRAVTGRGHAACAKLLHDARTRCIFCGQRRAARGATGGPPPVAASGACAARSASASGV